MIRSTSLTLAQLKNDVRTFLRSPNPSMVKIHDEIVDPLRDLGRVYVIGGLIRDIAIYGLEERPESDLDLVIRCSPRRLEEFALKIGGAKNRFGGFAVRTPAYRVDFWSFSKTWAKTAGHVNIKTPADLIKTTFFDWDAVVYSLGDHKLWAIDRYLHRLHSGLLDINLRENPSRLGSLVRALRRLMMWDARPSARLRHYIEHEIQEFKWDAILNAERNAFHSVYLSEFYSVDQFFASVLQRSSFTNRAMDRLRQAKFAVVEQAPRVQEPPRTYNHLRISTVPRRRRSAKAETIKDLFPK